MSNRNKIGIDKIILNNVTILSVDWGKFNRHPASIVKLATASPATREISGVSFSRLSTGTKGSIFSLEAKLSPDKNTGEFRPTERLYINPATLLYDQNVRNITTASDLQSALCIVRNRLATEYGITIDLNEAKISEIEINTNIQLSRPFSEYTHVFDFIKRAFPAKYKNRKNYEEDRQTTGFSVENTQLLLKFYDKLREAKILVDGSGNLLRIEYRFKCSDKVQHSLGYTELQYLLENFAVAKNAFIKNVTTDILTTIPNAIKEKKRQHRQTLLQAMQEQPRAFIDHWLAITENIFDHALMEETLLDVLRKLGRKARNNRARLKQLHACVSARQKETCIFGQLDLLNELLEKLHTICGTI